MIYIKVESSVLDLSLNLKRMSNSLRSHSLSLERAILHVLLIDFSRFFYLSHIFHLLYDFLRAISDIQWTSFQVS